MGSKFHKSLIQLQERKRRRIMDRRMRFGMSNAKGTPNQVYIAPRIPVVRKGFFTRLAEIFRRLFLKK